MTREILSKFGLERLHHVLVGHIERGDMQGLVAHLSCHGSEHVETLGTMSVDHSASITRDTIFRIASLTKPLQQRPP